jgi:2'-hydroxyisoflavone reductase
MLTRRTLMKTALAAGALTAAGCGTSATVKTDDKPKAPPPPPAKKSILILGGTAFLGPQVVEAAKAHGHTVTLFNRGKTNPQLFPELEKLHGDRNGDVKALEGRKWDAVVDTSGYTPKQVKLSAETLAPNIGHYVFISSISVYADPLPAHSDESAKTAVLADPTVEAVTGETYGGLKFLCEQAAESAMPGKTTNIRPGLIVGPGDGSDRFTYWPARLDRGGEVLCPGTGEDPGQVIDARDLGLWIVRVIEDGTTGVFNAAGPEKKLTMRELIAASKEAAGKEATLTWVDTDFLEKQGVAPWMELPVWTGGDLGFATVNAEKAIAKGLTFRPILDISRDTLAYWRSLPEERRAKPRAGLAPDKEAAVLKAWHERK